MHADTPANEPNSLSPFLSTAPAVDALNRLERGLGARRPFVLVTGPSGTGKSTLVHEALRRWGERVENATLDAPGRAAGSLALALLKAFGGTLKPGSHATAIPERLLETLANTTAGGRVAVLLVDDADSLADDALLELQRLAARAEQRQCPLELILVGSPALARRLDDGPLAALRADVSVRVALEPLSPHDTRHYLMQRPTSDGNPSMFSRKACRDIHVAASGRIRDIEAIAAESARRAARANATTISPEHVRTAAQAVRSRKPTAPVNASPGEAPPRVAPLPTAGDATTPTVGRVGPLAADKVAHTPPVPSEADVEAEAAGTEAPGSTAADYEPDAVAQGSHVDAEASASAAAGTLSDSGEFRPSDDPRVKDWLSRFGGSGVRIGANYATRSSREMDFSEDTAGDVRPIGSARAATSATPASPCAAAAAAPASAPAAASAAAPASASAPAPDSASAAASPRAPWHADAGAAEPAGWPPARAVPRKGPVLRQRRDSSFVWQATTLVLAMALGAVLLGQRNLTPREPRASTAVLTSPGDSSFTDAAPRSKSSRPKRSPKRDADRQVRQARTDVAEPTSVRYTVAVGTFLNAEMARAERDHLARLIPFRVWVNSSSVGGVASFRIQFGAFASRDEAETAAQKLLRQGLLRDASVMELPAAE